MLVDRSRGQECLRRPKIKINPSYDEWIIPESWYLKFQINRSFCRGSFKPFLRDSSRVFKAVLFGNSFKVHVRRWEEWLRVNNMIVSWLFCSLEICKADFVDIFWFYFKVKDFFQKSTMAIIKILGGSNFTAEFISIYNVAKEILRILTFNSKHCLAVFCGL